ncbi:MULTISPECIES: hypothetical protein [Rothia]|nr:MULTISPECIES: hypothetical protein [Rothia]
MLTGPLLMRALLPGLEPTDEHLMHQTINAALDSLGYRGDRGLLALPQ